jgi:hypothetical protein
MRRHIHKDRADYLVFCGEWNIGCIYEIRGGPDQMRLQGKSGVLRFSAAARWPSRRV